MITFNSGCNNRYINAPIVRWLCSGVHGHTGHIPGPNGFNGGSGGSHSSGKVGSALYGTRGHFKRVSHTVLVRLAEGSNDRRLFRYMMQGHELKTI